MSDIAKIPHIDSSLDEWLNYISNHHPRSIDLGLERLSPVWNRLKPDTLPVIITVGGTNGKGSVCAMLSSMLKAGGYKVGTYTSPHLWSFNERIAIQSISVSDQEIIQAFCAIEWARQDISLTYFEWATLAAFWIFSRHSLDIWILEVGMGGRLDATNLLDADVSIITSIDLDHQAYLGNTREAIGIEKLGIARPDHPLILGEAKAPEGLLEKAKQRHIPIKQLGQTYGYLVDSPQQWQYWAQVEQTSNLKRRFGLPWPALRGEHQLANASTAITALDYIQDRLPLSMQAIREGLLSVSWPGRFQVLPGTPITLCDVAHNPHAMRALAKNLDRMSFFPATWCIWGMLSDKEAAECAQLLQPHIQHWVVCSLHGERSRSAAELASILESLGILTSSIYLFESPLEAYNWVKTTAMPSDRIVITGSFSMFTNLPIGLQ
jgi:dihydrofolate synthase / folylpolyglutamate synthase